MKSKYFKQYFLSEENKKNVCVLAGLSDLTLDTLATWFLSLQTYHINESSVIKELSEKTGEAAETLRRAMHSANIFFKRMGEFPENTPDYLMDDLLEQKILSNTSPQLLCFLNKLYPCAKKYYLISRKWETSMSGAPNLSNYSMAVAVKPVFTEDFEYSTSDIITYNPTLFDYAVVALVSLERSDSTQEFAFQLTKDKLDRIITELLALQKQILVMEANLQISQKKE